MYTYDIYVDWQANPTITVINTTSFPIKNVEFPAITICSQGLAKDIMENVLIKQFESYLESKKIITDPNAKLNKREILDISKQKKLESLTDEEVLGLIFDNILAVYYQRKYIFLEFNSIFHAF